MKFGSWIIIERRRRWQRTNCTGYARRNVEGRISTEYGLSQNQLAKAIGISPNRIAEIVKNRRRITADTALRLSLYFDNSPEFWMKSSGPLRPENGTAEFKPQDARRIKSLRAA